MPGLVSEDIPEGVGPNASVPFGVASQVSSDQKALQSQTGSGQPPPPGGAQPPPQQPQPQPQSPLPTVHPAVQPAASVDPQPRNPAQAFDPRSVFTPPQLSALPGWRQRLNVWAGHPNTPYLNLLARAANANLNHDPAAKQ